MHESDENSLGTNCNYAFTGLLDKDRRFSQSREIQTRRLYNYFLLSFTRLE